MPSNMKLHNSLFLLLPILLLFSLFSAAEANTLDDQIEQIMKASEKEKKILVKQLKDEISKQKYDHTEQNGSKGKQDSESNSSIDKKITQRSSKFIPVSDTNRAKFGMDKCGPGKCGSGKCNMGTYSMEKAPVTVIVDDNMSCGCE